VDFDHIIVGSGLTALAVFLGLPRELRVAVVRGPQPGRTLLYDQRQNVPCAHLGPGGLGNFWHGVIPLWADAHDAQPVDQLLDRFYPGTRCNGDDAPKRLLVPWRPVRPLRVWRGEASPRLTMIDGCAEKLTCDDLGASVRIAERTIRARRVWLAAGALHTPMLLADSFGPDLARPVVDDHVICYLGQSRQQPPPQVRRGRHGLTLEAVATGSALLTRRPARFDFRQLDRGVELRAAFGLPTAGLVAKLCRVPSPGLWAEALYNRTGLLAASEVYSVYAQVVVKSAYRLGRGDHPVEPRPDALLEAIQTAHATAPSDILPTRQPTSCLPGIHLHHSVNLTACAREGLQEDSSPIVIADASVLSDLGPSHHSFRAMARAYALARRAC
jgi:hypothetical protein